MMKRRRHSFWFIRWDDLNWPNRDSMERIKTKAEKFAKANITTAMIYGCHFRWDYMPYFTILQDYLATVASELAKYGIELIDHHSVSLVHRYDTVEEMRHVMVHSNVHIPFSPSREMAKTWEYQGKRLNDWRMIDVRDGKPLRLPQYAAEGFCHRNPEFMEAYQDYAVKLVRDTGIKGLMADDTTYFTGYSSCGCRYCRQALKDKTGVDLPPVDDQGFWGNWENPAWRAWIDLRFDAGALFHRELRKKLPEDFMLMSCCSESDNVHSLECGSDARKYLEGTNYINLEMVGNVPPYKNDPYTVNQPLAKKLISASHHQAAAKEKGVRCYGIGYGFSEATANIVWAANKVLDSDCHFSALKARLGLPESILDTLPDAEDIIGRAYTFEAEHPELFDAEHFAEVGVYFSYETRNHTLFGNLTNGYHADYSGTLKALFRAGVGAHTLFSMPKDTTEYPIVILPSPASMTEGEIRDLDNYVARGGRVLICGPSAYPGSEGHWTLPTRPGVKPEEFFRTSDGIRMFSAPWVGNIKLSPSGEPNGWAEIKTGIYYNPHRVSDGELTDSLLDLCHRYGKKAPVKVEKSEGYFINTFTSKDGALVHLLAEDYDTDIDHKLDEMRFHRSRVNFINKVEPIGVSREVTLGTDAIPVVYTPFNDEPSRVEISNGKCVLTLPVSCPYAILKFKNN